LFVKRGFAMPVGTKKLHPALKHGLYSVIGILPGEDRAAFEKLRRDLMSELRAEGPLESDIVETIARLTWRKQNLKTLRTAQSARERYSAIRSTTGPSATPPEPYIDLGIDRNWEPPDPAVVQAANKAAVALAQEELGYRYIFVEMGDTVTLQLMFKDFEIEERFDAMIERLLKQLLFVKGLKSLPSAASSAPLPRIPGPRKVA
jgi:hypothetical protein